MMLIRGAGIAYTVAGILTGLSRHATRRQQYVPTEVLDRHGAKAEDIFAGQTSDQLKAALAELRRHARRQLAAAKADLEFAPATLLPALLPVALVGPVLRPMDRRGYEPFDVPAPVAVAPAMAAVARCARPQPHLRRLRLFGGVGLRHAAPEREIGQSALAHRRFLGQVLGRTAAMFAAVFVECCGLSERRKQTKIDVHRLERGRTGIDGIDVAAGDVAEQGAVRRGDRRRCDGLAPALGGGKACGQQSDRGGFDIAFAAGDLAGEAPARIGFEPQQWNRAASEN